jgi:hypothetical protein
MNTIETIFLIIALELVVIAALVLYEEIVITIKVLGAYFRLAGKRKRRIIHRQKASSAHPVTSEPVAPGAAILPPIPSPERSSLPAWLSRHRLKTAIPLVLLVVLIALPTLWWQRQSEAWRLVLSDQIAEFLALWKQDLHGPVREPRSEATLHRLTQLLDNYTGMLERDPHRVIELWVVDHYWQYWGTDTFNDYMRANRRFVDSGGKIHRMFILTEADLKKPQLTAVLRNQCENIGADVWRGDAAAIGNKAEYQITAKAFEQMPYTETGFRTFDVLQLGDLTYYSSDFSPDYRVVRASNWFYGQALDLKPLFNKSVAQRIDCSAWKTSQIAQRQ